MVPSAVVYWQPLRPVVYHFKGKVNFHDVHRCSFPESYGKSYAQIQNSKKVDWIKYIHSFISLRSDIFLGDSIDHQGNKNCFLANRCTNLSNHPIRSC